MVPPRYWSMFIPHQKHLNLMLWLVEETIICYCMPIEHFAHNPMELYFIFFFFFFPFFKELFSSVLA